VPLLSRVSLGLNAKKNLKQKSGAVISKHVINVQLKLNFGFKSREKVKECTPVPASPPLPAAAVFVPSVLC
jgi:hypothetical protein